MNAKGNGYDNAAMESFLPHAQDRALRSRALPHAAEARASVFEYIEVFYNRVRLHSTIDDCSPEEFEARRNAS